MSEWDDFRDGGSVVGEARMLDELIQPKGTAMTPDPASTETPCANPECGHLRQDHFQPIDGVCMKLRTPMDMCPCTSYVAPSSEVTAAQAKAAVIKAWPDATPNWSCDGWTVWLRGRFTVPYKGGEGTTEDAAWLDAYSRLEPLGGDSAQASGVIVTQCIEHDCEDCPICAEERGAPTPEPVEGKGFEGLDGFFEAIQQLHNNRHAAGLPLLSAHEEEMMRWGWQAALSAPRAQTEWKDEFSQTTSAERVALIKAMTVTELRRSLAATGDALAAALEREKERSEHDAYLMKLSCTTMDVDDKPMDEMTDDELSAFFELGKDCKCFRCGITSYILRLRKSERALAALRVEKDGGK